MRVTPKNLTTYNFVDPQKQESSTIAFYKYILSNKTLKCSVVLLFFIVAIIGLLFLVYHLMPTESPDPCPNLVVTDEEKDYAIFTAEYLVPTPCLAPYSLSAAMVCTRDVHQLYLDALNAKIDLAGQQNDTYKEMNVLLKY